MNNTTDFKAHTFCYKDEDGNWIEIPVLYQTVYASYLEYCRLHNMPTVTATKFYNTFQLLANVELLTALLESLEEVGVWTIETGGTGANTAEGARQSLNVPSITEMENAINTIADAFQTVLDSLQEDVDGLNTVVQEHADQLTSLGLTYGSDDPGPDTPGHIYFKI